MRAKIQDKSRVEAMQKEIERQAGEHKDEGLDDDWRIFKDTLEKVSQRFCEDRKGEKKRKFVSEATAREEETGNYPRQRPI